MKFLMSNCFNLNHPDTQKAPNLNYPGQIMVSGVEIIHSGHEWAEFEVALNNSDHFPEEVTGKKKKQEIEETTNNKQF